MATRHRALLGLTLVLFGAMTANAQEFTWAEKMFDKLSHDFGVVARGADVTHRIKVTNIYKETVHISGVRTTCGCAAASPSKSTLASRESAYIEISMDTRRFIRQKDSNVIVTFSAPYAAQVRIPVKAYIRTDVVLTPGSVRFDAIDQGSAEQRKVDIAYQGRPDWTIREVRTKSDHLSAEVREQNRQGGRIDYELFVNLESTAPAGPFREQITLVTDDANSPYVPVLVEGRVEADITVTPEVVSLGMLVPGESKTVNVVLRGKKPFTIEKIECESDLGAFKARIPNDSRTVHVLPLTILPPDKPGTINEELTVTIEGRPEPVLFRAYGRIGEKSGANNANAGSGSNTQ